MRRLWSCAATPLTWLLALLFTAALGWLLTATPLIWGKTDLWTRWRLGGLAFWQTYDVARKIERPRPAPGDRVVLLGNSRMWFPANEAVVGAELARLAPGRAIQVDNLAVFGMRVGDLEIVARRLPEIAPTLVILGISGSDLVETGWGKLRNPTGELLEVGWEDGPVEQPNMVQRANRWARTVWPLYRLRQFARQAIVDRLWPDPDDVRYPERFPTTRAFFDFVHYPAGATVEAAYDVFRRQPTLDNFVAYLKVTTRLFGIAEPPPDSGALHPDGPGVRYLDSLVAHLAAGPWKRVILLMPENPLLAGDTEGKYHQPGFSDQSVAIIRAAAASHSVPVIDGRRWMPAQAFADFYHLFPDLSGFQTPLAQEIVNELGP